MAKSTARKIKKVRHGEVLRFRDAKGRLTKFDGRKKLIAEVWRVEKYKSGKVKTKKTPWFLNSIKNGKPVPEKFSPKRIKKMAMKSQVSRVKLPSRSELKEMRITIDARNSIMDNIDIQCDQMLKELVRNSSKSSGTLFICDYNYKNPETGARQFEVFRLVLKGTRNFMVLSIAQNIIYRMYKEKMRMSNVKLSPIGSRGSYVRYVKAKFSWSKISKSTSL